jgi:hypothetical protein
LRLFPPTSPTPLPSPPVLSVSSAAKLLDCLSANGDGARDDDKERRFSSNVSLALALSSVRRVERLVVAGEVEAEAGWEEVAVVSTTTGVATRV